VRASLGAMDTNFISLHDSSQKRFFLKAGEQGLDITLGDDTRGKWRGR